MKNVCIRSFSGLYSLAFGLNMEIYSANLRIQPKFCKNEPEKLQIHTLFPQCNRVAIMQARVFYKKSKQISRSHVKNDWIIYLVSQWSQDLNLTFMFSVNIISSTSFTYCCWQFYHLIHIQDNIIFYQELENEFYSL